MMQGLWDKMRGRKDSVDRSEKHAHEQKSEKIANESGDYFQFAEAFHAGYFNARGITVNERTAMCVSAVYACVGLIAGAIASLPLPIFQRTSEGRHRLPSDSAWRLLNCEPSPTMTAAVFWEYLTASLLLQGDAFARIVRVGSKSPQIFSLEAWHPTNVDVRRIDGRLKYGLTDPYEGKRVVVDQDDMVHVPGIGFNGLRGMTPLSHALRSSAGIALAASEHSTRFFTNGARPDFVLRAPETANLTKEQKEDIRDAWNQIHGGPERAYKPAILTGGLDLKELTMKAEDAQLLATRQFAAVDVAMVFGVPPHMIGLNEKTSSWGSGVEQLSIGFVKYTLTRHITKFEQEINRKLLRDPLKFAEFDTAGIERGDLKTRYDAHRIAIGRAGEPGFKTVNEVRRLENLPPLPGFDTINNGVDHVDESNA